MSEIQRLDGAYVAHTYGRFPVTIVSGKGSVVRDEDGREYVDLGSGIGVTAFGIADDAWAQAVEAQLRAVQHMSNLYYTAPCALLAERLCKRTGLRRVFFGNSGAEANECAIKVARKWAAEQVGPEHHVIITLKNSFHGRTLTTLAATGQEHYHELFQPLTPGFAHAEPGDAADLERLLREGNAAAVLVECIQGEGGVRVMDDAFLREAAALAQRYHVLLMVDEVQTGNGRTGDYFAYMHAGIAPDVVTTAKGLGGGLPLGACLIGEKAADVLGPGDHGSTFGGNPVCCAGALSVIDRIDDALLAEVRAKGEWAMAELRRSPAVADVSGRGLMIGILPEKRAAGDIVRAAIDAGLLCLTAKNRVRLLPALNIPKPLWQDAVRRLIAVMEA